MTRKRSNKKKNTPILIDSTISALPEVKTDDNNVKGPDQTEIPVRIDTPRPSLTDWVVIDTDGDETLAIDR